MRNHWFLSGKNIVGHFIKSSQLSLSFVTLFNCGFCELAPMALGFSQNVQSIFSCGCKRIPFVLSWVVIIYLTVIQFIPHVHIPSPAAPGV